MSTRADWREERFEIPLADVDLTDGERRALLHAHCCRDSVVREVFDEVSGGFVVREVPLLEPVCWACGEPWARYGCPTHRAVVLLGIHEREAKKERRRVAELTEALTPRFGVHRLRETGNRTTELRMFVDDYTLMYGGVGVIEATLAKMHTEWRRWFKNVGDQQRARSDKLWALTLDNERYVYLTREFDAFAPAIKRPDAPWDHFDASVSRAPHVLSEGEE